MALPFGYDQFLTTDCNRKEFIQKWLLNYGINSSTIVIKGKSHIYVDFPKSCYDKRFKIKTLIAHYDKVPYSDGANDNSSGVFALLEAARRLQSISKICDQKELCHNTRIIFTDGEEEARLSISEQGSFSLGQRLNELNSANGDFYVFDCVGRGDVPVISEIAFNQDVDKEFYKKYKSLLSNVQSIVSKNSTYSNLILPTAFSDNAGLIANKIPAILITMLPKDEVVNYMSNLKRVAGLRESVLNRKLEDVPEKVAPEYILRESVPLTWRYLHTEYDKITTLTPISFTIISRIIDDIIKTNLFV